MKKSYTINKFVTSIFQKRPQKLLVLSVGNPSPKFDNTRHNAGHLALDYFIKAAGGLADEGMFWDSSVEMAPLKNYRNVLIAKSQEFMNNSGKAMKSAIEKVKRHDYRVIVLHDDIDTDVGTVKFKLESRQMGAHGGLSSITKYYVEPFARIRLGIGSPANRLHGTVASYVLKAIPRQEKEILLNKTIPDAYEMFERILEAMTHTKGSKKHNEANQGVDMEKSTDKKTRRFSNGR